MGHRRFDRATLLRLIALRHGDPEGVGSGDHVFLTGTIKVTPDLVEKLIGGFWTDRDGHRRELVGVYIDDDGLIYPEFREIA